MTQQIHRFDRPRPKAAEREVWVVMVDALEAGSTELPDDFYIRATALVEGSDGRPAWSILLARRAAKGESD